MEEVNSFEVARSLVRIETSLQKALDDHENRLRRIERVMWLALGVALAGGITGGSAFLSAMGGG